MQLSITAVNLVKRAKSKKIVIIKSTCSFKTAIYEPSSYHLLIKSHQQNLKTQGTNFLSNTNTFQHNLCHLIAITILRYIIAIPLVTAIFGLAFYCQIPASRTKTVN